MSSEREFESMASPPKKTKTEVEVDDLVDEDGEIVVPKNKYIKSMLSLNCGSNGLNINSLVVSENDISKVYLVYDFVDSAFARNIDDPMDMIELGEDALYEGWNMLPPKEAEELWDKFQNKDISEGIYVNSSTELLILHLQSELNLLIDDLANNEPIDFLYIH